MVPLTDDPTDGIATDDAAGAVLRPAIERFYDALRDGELADALETLDPGVVLHVPGEHSLAGEHHGAAGLLEFVLGSRELTVDGEHIELLDVLVGRDHVAALCRVTGERPDGRVLDNRTLHLMRTTADGRIAEVWLHNWDQDAVAAFWSAP